ncbi:MAG TPA: class I SAM-dependent methyltransferase, partial [Polyangiaceae bacterium]|nr:class I SAM-dependent methyltransferase [Polyangiaceae bacterium]
TDPARFADDLAREGLDIRDGLHIRAFIDHNRRYQPPEPSRVYDHNDRSTGAFVTEDGEAIPNLLLERNLIEFLSRWAQWTARHGILILEAHSVEPKLASRHVGDIHNITFDFYHGCSHQYHVEFEVFMRCAEAAGLAPILYRQARYPSKKPFVSISVNHFVVGTSDDLIPRSPNVKRGTDEWVPEPNTPPADGEALHQLLYHDGNLRYARNWVSNACGLLVKSVLEDVGARLRGGKTDSIRIVDYGTGTGLIALELMKALRQTGLLHTLESRKVSLTLELLDIPSSWFAKGYELLKDCPYVRFRSIRRGDSFIPLHELLGEQSADILIASMVFHLIPVGALPRVFDAMQKVLVPGGQLIWNSPDLGPTIPHSVLFHEANRRLRRRALELLERPELMQELLERLPEDTRDLYADLPTALEKQREELTPERRAQAQVAANRQILPAATPAALIHEQLSGHFEGSIHQRTFEMRIRDSVDSISVPSNQLYLTEVEDAYIRQKLTNLLMWHDIMPPICRGEASTGFGFNVLWTFGRYINKTR